MSVMHPLERALADAWPPASWRDVTVLAAISGGADSVALLRAMVAIREPGPGRIIVAHFNHQLRGAESDADERLVRELAARLKLDCEVGKPSQPPQASHSKDTQPSVGVSLAWSEESARQARYEFLAEAACRWGARFVVTAHTADDLVETVLHRIVRGTGIGGLTGIPRRREFIPGVALIRPLLDVRRTEVIEYLDGMEQSFCEDASNRDTAFTRNRIRHELLPMLASQYNPQVFEAIHRLARLASGVQQIVEDAAEQLLAKHHVSRSTGRVVLNCDGLASASPHLVREMFIVLWKQQGWPRQAMSFEKWDELASAVGGPDRKYVLPGGIAVDRAKGQLTLTRSSEIARFEAGPT